MLYLTDDSVWALFGRFVAVLLALAALAWLTGCGGGPVAPSSPLPPEAVTVRLFDGITGGQLGAQAAHAGDGLSLSMSGYLERATLVPRDGAVFLWPAADPAWTMALVYHDGTPRRRMIRWAKAELLMAADIPEVVLEELNSTGAVRVRYGAPPDIDARVAPDELPTATALAATRNTFAGDTITHSTILLREASTLTRGQTMKHEAGHALGLGHSARREDLMFATSAGGATFTQDERVVLTMMYARRRPGNAAPDNDTALGAASARTVRVIE